MHASNWLSTFPYAELHMLAIIFVFVYWLNTDNIFNEKHKFRSSISVFPFYLTISPISQSPSFLPHQLSFTHAYICCRVLGSLPQCPRTRCYPVLPHPLCCFLPLYPLFLTSEVLTLIQKIDQMYFCLLQVSPPLHTYFF